MKAVFILLFTLLASVTAFTQIKWGVEAGLVNTNNHYAEKLDGAPGFTSGTGFVIGGLLSYKIIGQLTGETGINYQRRNFTLTSAAMPDNTYQSEYRLDYLLLNQNILVMTKPRNGFSFGTGAGLFMGYAMSGQYKLRGSFFNGAVETTRKMKLGDGPDDDLRNLDMGLNMVVRSQYKNYRLTLQYSPSLRKNQMEQNRSLFRNVTFTLGYQF
jgi:hypothetical protein